MKYYYCANCVFLALQGTWTIVWNGDVPEQHVVQTIKLKKSAVVQQHAAAEEATSTRIIKCNDWQQQLNNHRSEDELNESQDKNKVANTNIYKYFLLTGC